MYVTTGVLLQKVVSAKSLAEFTHIFVDEVGVRLPCTLGLQGARPGQVRRSAHSLLSAQCCSYSVPVVPERLWDAAPLFRRL